MGLPGATPEDASVRMSLHLSKGYHEARELVLADPERAYLEHAIRDARQHLQRGSECRCRPDDTLSTDGEARNPAHQATP